MASEINNYLTEQVKQSLFFTVQIIWIPMSEIENLVKSY